MRSRIAFAVFILTVVASAALLALGFTTNSVSGETRALLFSLHVSLGVVAAAAVLAAIVLRLAVPPPPLPAHWPAWRRRTVGLAEFLLYAGFIAVVLTGALWAYCSGAELRVFGAPLPVSASFDRTLEQALGERGALLHGTAIGGATLSELFLAAHRLLTYVLAGVIAALLLLGALGRFRPAHSAPPAVLQLPAPDTPAAALAGRMRLFGWGQFWLQLAIALASGVLLQFSTSGRAFSPSASGWGDAIYWSLYAFLLLCAATALAFYYTRAARFVVRPDYLGAGRRTAFWFLSLGLLIGLSGTIISFIGLSLSISLLIAKTVSQPPGIAITDPNKIIRALDVFVLLVNFCLLLGHFIGAGVAAWLAAGAARARFRYATRPPQAQNV
jgi:cytochrome b561